MSILVFLLISFGITTIITKSDIFKPIRDFVDTGGENVYNNFFGILIHCPMCMGFWVGLIVSCLTNGISCFYIETYLYLAYFFDAVISSGVCWFMHVFIYLADVKSEEVEAKKEMYEIKYVYYEYEIKKGLRLLNDQDE